MFSSWCLKVKHKGASTQTYSEKWKKQKRIILSMLLIGFFFFCMYNVNLHLTVKDQTVFWKNKYFYRNKVFLFDTNCMQQRYTSKANNMSLLKVYAWRWKPSRLVCQGWGSTLSKAASCYQGQCFLLTGHYLGLCSGCAWKRQHHNSYSL